MVEQALADHEQHIPVLLEHAINALNIRPNGIYLDGTYGRGGHSKQILAHLGSQGRLLAIDRDPAAARVALINHPGPHFTMMQGLFSQLAHSVKQQALVGKIDGILLDLGVSSPQLENPQRGFSFLRDGPLDMRMDPEVGLTAAQWLGRATLSEIAWVLKNLGEERFARRIAAAIVEYRQQQPLNTTRQLAELIGRTIPRLEQHKHPATRSFQAIRIYLNNELSELQQALEGALQVLAPQGRLVVISFHSLEDRLVKRFMRDQSRGKILPPGLPLTEQQLEQGRRLRLLGKVVPSTEEIRANPRARSAILRVAEKTVQPHVC